MLGRIGNEMGHVCVELVRSASGGAPPVEEPSRSEAGAAHAAEWCDLRGVLGGGRSEHSRSEGVLARSQQREEEEEGSSSRSRAESSATLTAKFALWEQLGRALARHCAALSGV